jgi:hypothetical protein
MLIWMFRTGLDEIGLYKYLCGVLSTLRTPFCGKEKKKSRNAYADFMLKFQHVGSPTMDLLHTGYLCSHWSEMPDWTEWTMTQWHYISSRFQRRIDEFFYMCRWGKVGQPPILTQAQHTGHQPDWWICTVAGHTVTHEWMDQRSDRDVSCSSHALLVTPSEPVTT